MHLHPVMAIAAWLIAFAWVAKFFEAARGLARVPNLLAAEYDAEPAGMPSITVIVPARNEAANVRACLESLLRQDYGNLRIVAIDDRSIDRTGAILEGLASDGRLDVMRVASLPAGWLGKTHAMAVAAQHAVAGWEPDYLLFTDADVVFREDAIRRSLVEVVASHADHFVTLPTTVTKTPGESMILAYLQVISLWAVRTWRVADPKSKRDALGVGAFNLVRTEAYLRLGGFEVTPMEILEDLTFGRRVKEAGLRQRVATAPGMVSVHWAAGVQGIVNGMTKNVFAVFHFRPALLLGAAVGMAVQCLGPVGFLAAEGTRLPAVIALTAVVGLYWLSSRTSRISPVYAVMFPVGAVLVVYAMLRSMVITVRQGGVTWRGTFYPLDELRRHDRADAHLVS
jgi:glycosyltransferase involved in cell wall biosynthesis